MQCNCQTDKQYVHHNHSIYFSGTSCTQDSILLAEHKQLLLQALIPMRLRAYPTVANQDFTNGVNQNLQSAFHLALETPYLQLLQNVSNCCSHEQFGVSMKNLNKILLQGKCQLKDSTCELIQSSVSSIAQQTHQIFTFHENTPKITIFFCIKLKLS